MVSNAHDTSSKATAASDEIRTKTNMGTDATSTPKDEGDSSGHAVKEEILALPPPISSDEENVPQLKFGETLSLEELGPIIINSDGSTRRIANWDKLTKKEQEVTWRRISKRNEERRNKLLLEQQQQQQQQVAESERRQEEKEL